MENKITLAAVAAIILLAFAGIAFAVQGANVTAQWGAGQKGMGVRNHMNNSTNFNGTLAGMGWRGHMNNSTNFDPAQFEGMGFRNRLNNSTAFNATQFAQFQSAVESGDYATAMQLHTQYGLGGPLFGKLNETTFAQFSQIRNLENQLQNLTSRFWQELGPVEQQGMGGFREDGFGPENGMMRPPMGMGEGRHLGRGKAIGNATASSEDGIGSSQADSPPQPPVN
jgi:hypothetical protein